MHIESNHLSRMIISYISPIKLIQYILPYPEDIATHNPNQGEYEAKRHGVLFGNIYTSIVPERGE
jgi:hypothetical protein